MNHVRPLLSSLALAAALALPACQGAAAETASPASPPAAPAAPTRVQVAVGASGYTPASIEATAGRPLTLVFRRVSDEGCGQEVVFPDHNIRRSLPLNTDVEVTLTPRASETIRFTCGMGMYRGAVVARR